MILHERITKLTTSKREYNRLYGADNLYIAWGVGTDDPKVTEFAQAIDVEYYTTRDRLVGKNNSTAKIENKKVTGPLQGYVYTVTNQQADMFEKIALMPSMRYSRRFEKYDLNTIKLKEQEEIIEKLKEEN
jgi:hypothetical protein